MKQSLFIFFIFNSLWLAGQKVAVFANIKFVLSDINKELAKLTAAKNFRAQHVMNDKFNLENTKKVKIKVECSKALNDAYTSKFNEKDEWTPSMFETRVIFKD